MILKAEIHCHLEGAAHPDFSRILARRHNVSIDHLFDDRGAYKWADFTSFLKAYDTVAELLKTDQDYADLVYDYLGRSAREGVIYTEFFISPGHAARLGMPYREHVLALEDGIKRAEKEYDVHCRLIATCVRHVGPEDAINVAREVAANPNPYVTGFGMGGDERMHHPKDFAPAYEIARDAGLSCTVHAGEFGGPESVHAALDHLPVDRIGHGVRSIEDPDLVKRLVDEGVVLEICPGSNVELGVYADRASHPLAKLMEAGVKTTISSDDPPFFHTSIGTEYVETGRVLGLTDLELQDFTKRSIEAAYVDETTRTHLLGRLD